MINHGSLKKISKWQYQSQIFEEDPWVIKSIANSYWESAYEKLIINCIGRFISDLINCKLLLKSIYEQIGCKFEAKISE